MTRTAEAATLASPLGSVLVTLGAAGQMINTAGGAAGGLDQLDSECVSAWGDLARGQFDAR